MRVPAVVMVMMGGHELLYYNICGRGKAGDPEASAKGLIFLHFGVTGELPSRGPKAMLRSLFLQPLPLRPIPGERP
jgi:hypothetical protein